MISMRYSMLLINICLIHWQCVIEWCHKIKIYPYYSDKALLAQNVPSFQIHAFAYRFFYSMSLSLNSDKTKRREMKKSFIQMPEWSLLVDILISFHAFPSIFFFWGTAEVLQSHIENLQTLISTEITHQRLLPLNYDRIVSVFGSPSHSLITTQGCR